MYKRLAAKYAAVLTYIYKSNEKKKQEKSLFTKTWMTQWVSIIKLERQLEECG